MKMIGSSVLNRRHQRRIASIGVAAIVTAATSGAAFAQPDGAALFAQNCSACHQLTGKGVPGAFPALAGDALVNGPPAGLAMVVVNGRGGMPAFGNDLSNADIAAVLTYVRSAWGNHAAAMESNVVKSVRTGAEPAAEKSGMQAH